MRGLLLWALLALTAGCREQGDWGKTERRRFMTDPSQAANVDAGRFHFVLPVGVERQRFALAALESLHIGSNVNIKPIDPTFYGFGSARRSVPAQGGFVASMGELTIESGSTVHAIYAFGKPPQVASGVHVPGFVKGPNVDGAQAFRPGLGAFRTTGSPVEQILFTAPEYPSVTIKGPVVSRASEAGAKPVAPGRYESLVVEARSRMRLSTGSYVLESLDVQRDGVLELDNADGPVEVWVTRHLNLGGELEDAVLEPTVLIAYAGVAPVKVANAFRATLVAPHATVTVARAASPHAGSFFARRLVVENGTQLLHIGFMRWRPLPPALDLVCAECTAKSLAAARSCCAEAAVMAASLSDQSSTPGGEADEARNYGYAECLLAAQAHLEQCEVQNRWRPGSCAKAGYREPVDARCGWR